MKKNITHIVGIDEAGRGPLAGPIAFGFFCIKKDFNKKFFRGAKDSKKMTALARADFFKKILDGKKDSFLNYKVCFVSNSEIDKKGLSVVIKKVIASGLKSLKVDPEKTLVLLDGSLYAPKEFIFQKTIIKGDDKEKVISCASIVAKVSRDRKMISLAKKYPEYGFDIHKGYGTLEHRKMIKKYGPSPIHRLSFLSRII